MFLLNPRSKQPLYEQLVEQLRRQIVLGGMKAGAAMPSVRQLATELGINPNTIQKAYRRMEEEGMILSIPGKGSFVSDNLAEMLTKQREDQRNKARQILLSCREMGITKEEIVQMVEAIYEEGEVCSR
jgi:GntR family transcriptional regulator